MKAFVSAALAACMGVFLGGHAFAQGAPEETYCALMSENDHFASDGFALEDAASILRQDRANYHKFGLRDGGDSGDSTFGSADARARIPDMLARGSINESTKRAIVGGTPDVCVDVYPRSIDVYLAAGGEDQSAGGGGDLPFVGVWNCEVATFVFTPTVYNNGSEDIPIQEVQEGSDGSYTLLFADDYFITLSGLTGDGMGWLSSSGDSFQCTREP